MVGGRASEVLPLQKGGGGGAEKVVAVLKGGHTNYGHKTRWGNRGPETLHPPPSP